MYHRVIRSKNFSVSYTDCNNRLYNNIPVLYLSIFQFDTEFYPAWLFNTCRRFRSFIAGVTSAVKSTVKRWERRTKIAQLRRSTVCSGVAEEYWRFDDHIVIECGDTDHSGHVYCPRCMSILKLEYPQGWHYYPGDVCEHGKYVGGCGADIMCGRCESE